MLTDEEFRLEDLELVWRNLWLHGYKSGMKIFYVLNTTKIAMT
jgi:hypothetical protein